MRQITRAEFEAAVDAYLAGDPKPNRKLGRRAFWWGFCHPFGSRRSLWEWVQ